MSFFFLLYELSCAAALTLLAEQFSALAVISEQFSELALPSEQFVFDTLTVFVERFVGWFGCGRQGLFVE